MANTEFEIRLLSITDIEPTKLFNYTTDDLVKQHKLQCLITKYGQVDLIKVIPCGDKFEILSGKRIFEACKTLEMSEVVCLIIPNLETKDKLILSLALNELNFECNYVELSKEIFNVLSHKDINECKHLLPYDQDIMEKMEQIAKFDWKQLNPEGEKKQYTMFGE